MEFMLEGPVDAAESRHADDTDAAALRALFHDIANHLVTFSCMLEAVDRDFGMSAQFPVARSHVSMMRTQTARMLALLKDSVDQGMQPAVVEVRSLVREVASAANARRLAAVTMDSGGERWLRTYPAALFRAVANIVDNAVRAAGENGHVAVALHDGPGTALIEVTDDGPGFGNIESGTASLGLRIAANLIEKCSGQVTVLPARPQGVRAVLEFPDLTGVATKTTGDAYDRRGDRE
jgi:signal transduction histidine kinase